MIIKEIPVSKQYNQVYFTFSINTINDIYLEIMEKHNYSEDDYFLSSEEIAKLVLDFIEEEVIEEEISKLDKIPLSSRKYRYLSKLERDNPLLVICQYCVLSLDTELKFPPLIPVELLSIPYDEVLRDFINNMLIRNKEFREVIVDKADQESIVTYNLKYTQNDFLLSEVANLKIDLSEEAEESILFLNCRKGDIIKLDESDKVKVSASVKKIHKLVVKELSDELVESFKFFKTKTVEELNNKVKDIFTFSTISIALITYLVDYVMKTGDLEFDEYVMAHFLDDLIAPTKEEEQDLYISEVKKQLVREYIITIINLNYLNDDPRFINNIIEEYEFEKILFNNSTTIDSYQEYLTKRIYETRVLEYCIEHNIIKYPFK